MSTLRLILGSLFHYRWVNLSVLAGVALTSAILSGALVVGDSVKESLRRHAEARLSKIGPAFFGGERFFTTSLADRVAEKLGMGAVVAPILQVEGTASNREGGRRVNRIQIVGVDERFWKLSLGGVAPEGFADPRWIGINGALADRIGAKSGDTLIVRIEIPGALSRDAPLSGESEQTTPFTAEVTSVLDAESFGLYSVRAEQVPPATLYLPRQRLEEIVEQAGRSNLVLAAAEIPAADLASAVEQSWELDDLQLTVAPVGEGGVSQVISSRIFFDEVLVKAFEAIAPGSAPVLTYLATDIAKGEAPRGTPYSMVAGTAAALNGIVGDLKADEIILSDWLAEDLGAAPGDAIRLTYNVVGPGRKLVEQQRSFRVKSIAALEAKGWDRSWTPEFPGIFDVDGLDDWEPGIPIDRDRIRDKDDVYWDQYKATPKAFVSLEAARSMWANRFGDSTAIRFRSPVPVAQLPDALRETITLGDLGMATRDLAGEAAAAVAGSFDFGSLFASMSFFLIIAALVLAGLVFVFGIEQRATQIGLFLALGFTRRQVRRRFLIEALLLSLAGAALGLAGGYLYTRLALAGMSGVWQEAAAGVEFLYFLKPASLATAFVVTVIVALVVVWLSSRRVMAVHPATLISGFADDSVVAGRRRWDRPIFLVALLGALGCLFAPKVEGTMEEQGLFFGAGFLITLAGVALCSILIRRFLRPSATLASLGSLGRQHTVRKRGRSLAVIGLMAAGVFMVTAINSFRLDGSRGAERRDSGTGGFAYAGESTVPVYEDLSGGEGRRKYGLDSLKQDFRLLSFRVSEGEDASCLNLNRAQRPRLLGVQVDEMAALNPFHFTKTASAPTGDASPWTLLSEKEADAEGMPVIPGIVDQNSAIYALRKSVGDLVPYETVSGEAFAVRIVGFLDTSILQGRLMIDEAEFLRFFPDAGGYRYFLLDGGAGESTATLAPVAAHLTRMFGDLGLEMRPAADQLNEFNAVQNTYLSIFSTLGGLGIFLGTLGLAILVGRNVMERRGQLGVMQAVGFTRRALAGMVLSEHWFLHLSGVVVGLGAALLAVLPKLGGGSTGLPWSLLAAINGGVLVGGLVFCALAARAVLRGRLLDAIRQE